MILPTLNEPAGARLFRLGIGLWAAALALGALPLLAPAVQAAWAPWASALVVALVIFASEFQRGRLRSGEERRFWRLLSAGLGCWFLQYALPVWQPLDEALNVGLYSLVLLALVVRPHLEGVRTSSRLQERLRAAGTAVFALGLLVYLLGVTPPAGLAPARARAPALALYVALDDVVLLRLWAQWRDARAPRWRAGKLEELTRTGMLLGVEPDVEYQERSIWLMPGDFVLLYTDGITEAVNASFEEYGTERLARLVLANSDASASDILDALLGSVNQFTGDSAPFDEYHPHSYSATVAAWEHCHARDRGRRLFFQRYLLESSLGQGGFGVVYRAYDNLLDRKVAIKFLTESSLGSQGRAKLLHEAKSAAGLNHPHIIQICCRSG